MGFDEIDLTIRLSVRLLNLARFRKIWGFTVSHVNFFHDCKDKRVTNVRKSLSPFKIFCNLFTCKSMNLMHDLFYAFHKIEHQTSAYNTKSVLKWEQRFQNFCKYYSFTKNANFIPIRVLHYQCKNVTMYFEKNQRLTLKIKIQLFQRHF